MKKFINLCKKPLLIVAAALFVVSTVLLVLGYTIPMGKTYKGTYAMDASGGMGVNVKISMTITLKTNEKCLVKQTFEFDEEEAVATIKGKIRESILKDPSASEMTEEALKEKVDQTYESSFYKQMIAGSKKTFDEYNKLGEIEFFYVVKDGKIYVSPAKSDKFPEEVMGMPVVESVKELETLIEGEEGEDGLEPMFTQKGYKLVMETEGQVINLDKVQEGAEPEYETLKYEFPCTANTAIQITSIVLMVVFGLCTAGCVTILILDKKGLLTKKEETTETAA